MGLLIPQYVIFAIFHVILSIINFAVMIPLLSVLFGTVELQEVSYPEFSFSVSYFENLFNYHFQSIIETKGSFSALYFICIIIVSATALSNLFKYLSILILTILRINVTKNLRNEYLNKLLNFDLKYFSSSRKGDLISRGTADVLEIESTTLSAFTILVKEPLLIIGYFAILFKMSAELTLYTFILLPLSGFVITQIVKRLKKSAHTLQDTLGQIGNILDESIGGMRVIKAFAAEQYISKKFKKIIDKYSRVSFYVVKTSSLAPPTSEIFGAMTLALLMLIGGKLILTEQASLTAEEFIVFLVIFSQILAPAKAISNAVSAINKGLASGERVFSLLDTLPEITSEPHSYSLDQLKKGIEFKHVCFAYEKKHTLNDISFNIPKGSIVALVGPSGGGKSTIADLVPRFYDPKEGEILLDDKPLRNYQIKSLRGKMGVVTQESILFHDTVFNNIAFGQPNATLQEVQEAAKVANSHDFISTLPDGYYTTIGERGTKLSGGQRQRLSIARAVLKNPPILILDEATSALDSESEKLVQEAIYNLMKNRTVLVIAHRLSTIQNADQIVVVQEGKIVEKGTHQKLLAEDGLYKKLSDMQSF